MAKGLIPVDAYIRVSRVGDRQGDRFISPDLQRESIERVCKREGLTVERWFTELDASGGDSSRPLWNEALERVESGTTRGIVCWNLSRFSRSLSDSLAAIDRIEEAGGKLYSEEGQLGKLNRNILMAIAEDERDRAKAGFRNATANAIARGVYIAARIPFGYERDVETRRLSPNHQEAPLVLELFERRAKGESWKQLTRWMLEAHGRYFAPQTLRGMINNPAYIGVARQGKIVNEHAHPAVVTRKLWDEAQRAKGRKPAHTGASKKLLLRGLVTCASCGHVMVVGNTRGRVIQRGKKGWQTAKREKIPTYTCRNQACTAHAYANAAETDELVSAIVLDFVSILNAQQRDKGSDPKGLAQAERELEQAEDALDRFTSNTRAITILGEEAWNELLEEYVVARNVAQAEVESRRSESAPTFDFIPELWREWTTESRREFLSKVIHECSVKPAHGQKAPVHERLELNLNFRESETFSLNQEVKPDDLIIRGSYAGKLGLVEKWRAVTG